MKPLQQRFRHKPDDGIYGDCHRACIASLLELELELDDVPHFGDGMPDADEFNRRVDAFLKARDLVSVGSPYDCTLEHLLIVMKVTNPGAFYLLGGTSKTGVNHTVIGYEDKIIHDPSITQSGIVGPCDDGFLWVTWLSYQPGRSAAFDANFQKLKALGARR